jgi:FtsH-binding integral membrane protein
MTTLALFVTMTMTGLALDKPLKGGGVAFLLLIGIIVVSVTNIFLRLRWLDVMISCVTVVVFSFLTAYDINKYGKFCAGQDCCSEGTIALWLDFANMFSALNRS